MIFIFFIFFPLKMNKNTVLNNSDLVLYVSEYLTDKETFTLFSLSKTLNNMVNTKNLLIPMVKKHKNKHR